LRLSGDFDSGADGDEIVKLDNIGVAEADTACTRGLADEILAIGPVNVDVAILAGLVVRLFAFEPEDAGEDEVLFLQGVGGFPNAAGGFAPNELGAGFGLIANLLADAVPAKGGLVAFGFRSGPFFGGGDREGAGDGAVIGDDVETLGRDGDAEVHWLLV